MARTVVSVHGEAPLRPRPSPANYSELIAGIRADNPQAVTNFRKVFTAGIQFFITRESNKIDVPARVEDVLLSVIEEVRKGNIDSPGLPSQIRKLLRQNIGPAKYDSNRKSLADAPQWATSLLKAMPEREREALKRYYVDLESENNICAELGITTAQLRNSKLRFKTQFRKTWRQTREIRSKLKSGLRWLCDE